MSEGEAVLTDADNKVLTAVCKSGAKGGLTNEEVSQTPGTIWSSFTLVCLVPPAIITLYIRLCYYHFQQCGIYGFEKLAHFANET